jgi:hypothetical protein
MAGRMHPCSKNPSTPLDFFSLLLTMESVVPEDRALLESNPSAADDAETHRPGTRSKTGPPVSMILLCFGRKAKNSSLCYPQVLWKTLKGKGSIE